MGSLEGGERHMSGRKKDPRGTNSSRRGRLGSRPRKRTSTRVGQKARPRSDTGILPASANVILQPPVAMQFAPKNCTLCNKPCLSVDQPGDGRVMGYYAVRCHSVQLQREFLWCYHCGLQVKHVIACILNMQDRFDP